MLRPHVLLLIVCCFLLCISYRPGRTAISQGTNHSLSLNGTSSYVSVPNSTSINTRSAWAPHARTPEERSKTGLSARRRQIPGRSAAARRFSFYFRPIRIFQAPYTARCT